MSKEKIILAIGLVAVIVIANVVTAVAMRKVGFIQKLTN